MKKLFLILLLLSVCFFAACSGGTESDRAMADETERVLTEANNQLGLPNIVNFQQKKTLKMIYELTDKEDLICYAYMFSGYQGKLIYIGKCVGYGIPFSAQYSNPQKQVYSSFSMPQAEPNGLFMPVSSSATWLIMIDPKSQEPRPVYFEPTIVVSPFPLL